MKTMMTSKPDYRKAEREAYNLLELAGVSKLPVKVKKLKKHFPNLQIKTYTWYSKKWGITLEEVCDHADSDLGCCWYRKSLGKYIILYNDTIDNVGRIRWTIAHELGHFILKHNEITNKSIIARSSLTEEEYEIFEKEANCFARTLLAPPPVITNLGKIDIYDIANICNISFEAATHVMSFLIQGQQMGIVYTNRSKVADVFSDFIFKTKNTHYCISCQKSFVYESPNFCPLCGLNNLIRTLGGEMNMIYPSIQLDENHRAVECPKCKNENIIGDYCQICGSYLVNKCTGFTDEPGNRYEGSWHELNSGCGKLLSGESRFCIECGSTSTFYESGLLSDWETEQKILAEEEIAASSDTTSDIDEDDLPF